MPTIVVENVNQKLKDNFEKKAAEHNRSMTAQIKRLMKLFADGLIVENYSAEEDEDSK